jgi:Domain of unknown function (DUF4365)
MTMSPSTQKEHLGYLFVRAMAYAAGYSCYTPEVDDDSIDIGIAKRGAGGTVRSPRLELQVKCTGAGIFQGKVFGYQLTLKNYDDLRHDDYQSPRILVVVMVPATGRGSDWLKQTHQKLTIHHCGYWLSLRGLPAYAGKARKDPKLTVHLVRSQPFNVKALTEIMQRISVGGQP